MKKKIPYLLIFIIIILIIILIFNNNINNNEKFQTNQVYNIIIIAGQSNSKGTGSRNIGLNASKYGAILTIPDDSIDNDIKMFDTFHSRVLSAQNPISTLESWSSVNKRADVGNHFDNCNLVGFALTFAKAYKSYRNRTPNSQIMIAGCSYSGSGFNTASKELPYWWRPTDSNITYYNPDPNKKETGKVSSLYLMTKNKLLNMKNNIHHNSKVVAILWHQGETDSGYIYNTANKNQYLSWVTELFRNLRNDVKNIFPQSSTNVPILLGGLCPETYRNRITGKTTTSGFSNMTSFIKNTIVPSISNSYFVSAEPITGFQRYLEGDNVLDSSGNEIQANTGNYHFSADSQREFGKRYYSVFNSI